MNLRSLSSAFFSILLFPALAKRPNILVILTDDHRYDALGFLGHPFLKTPHMDRLAAEGVHFQNAYVTTSLCSPSRASILTGLYAHNHRVVDNYNPVGKSLTFFPELLQSAGYQTAFIGKWHMGDSEEKQRGFDYWLSFKGQGVYVPDPAMLKAKGRFVPQATNSGFNINGKRVAQKGYITDELTDYAVEWLGAKDDTKPFLLYVSHKGVHADFLPPDRHAFKYDEVLIPTPPTPLSQPTLFTDPPMWVRNQSNSRHG
ncbi:sulfatase-like hydrolase/transferase, partial [bacterium]|nr:sulfatase-like hydrolase/transferase [bacterium]